MSKYPSNPHWDHETDRPVRIVEQAIWAEAEAAGHITPQHYEDRMRNRVMHALGLDDGFMAYDEDGFASALIAEGIKAEGGVTLHVYPGDHGPAHFHITKKDDSKVNLRIALETGEVLKNSDQGKLSNKEVKSLIHLAMTENIAELEALWAKNGYDRKTAQ